jgi:hypothetical protein
MNNPIELFDGFEPEELWFDPKDYGYSSFERIDLIKELGKKYKSSNDYKKYRPFYDEFSNRVSAKNKSSGKEELKDGYFAVLKEKESDQPQIVILFSFFEVSPMRYHAYLHEFINLI